MMKSHNDLKFAIIGGGIAGLTLAIALHHRGLKVKIYEQTAQFQEIGAGVSFTPNAVAAMKLCHDEIYQAFERVCTRNIWPSKQKVWFDYYDAQNADASQTPAFTIYNSLGQNGVHRAHFLDELVKLLPKEVASFGKRLDRYEEDSKGKIRLIFTDQTEDEADVILACDGIKSRVRQLLFGTDHPCAFPSYSHKYAYRALVPMDDAISAIGEEKAQNAAMHVSISRRSLLPAMLRGR
jgi:salicylate hydroxylase